MNPLYQQLSGMQSSNTAAKMSSGSFFRNPVQKMNYIMQAMQNPAAFVRQHFPDIPDSIANNPGQILSYLQQTRGISDQQIQQLAQTYGGKT